MGIAWDNIMGDDREAFSKAYLELYNRFYNYGSLLTSDVSLIEDSIQEVLLVLWTSRKNLSSIANPDGYYYTLFRRALFKRLKSTANLVAIEQGEWEPAFAADAVFIKKEADQALQQKMKAAVDSLTSRQREAIYLRFYEGLSYEQVAATLDISVKGTYKIIARALQSLKDKISIPLISLFLLLREMS